MLNFIAVHLQLYKILKIMQVLYFGTQLVQYFSDVLLHYSLRCRNLWYQY